MKKIFYILLLTIVSGLSFTSCTEEEVTPSTELTSSGGAGQEETGKGR
jgi:hypothetical protein